MNALERVQRRRDPLAKLEQFLQESAGSEQALADEIYDRVAATYVSELRQALEVGQRYGAAPQ